MTSTSLEPQKNPSDLLDTQVRLLNNIYQVHLKQQELLERIRVQQERQLPPAIGSGNVKIIDFNMPFMALVGLLVKFALASIPAAIIIAIIWSVILFVVTFGLSMLGVGLSVLGGR